MSIEYKGDLFGNLRILRGKTNRVDDDLYVGAEVILKDSLERVPKESGDLASSGAIKRDRGGNNTVAIEYTSVYAHWIHEHLHFKHDRGGESKFLETAMIVKGSEAINKAGQHLWNRL